LTPPAGSRTCGFRTDLPTFLTLGCVRITTTIEGGAMPGDGADDGYPSFVAFVEARQRALLRSAYLVTGDHHLAEDLLQVALIKLALRW